jgi:hypothetical protein
MEKLEMVLNELVEKNVVDEEDIEHLKLCLLLLHYGWKKKEYIRKQVKLSKEEFNEVWDNLKKSKYFYKDGKIWIEEIKDDLPILLMLAVARGYVRRTVEKKKKRINKKSMFGISPELPKFEREEVG